jgi:hypothetical protein
VPTVYGQTQETATKRGSPGPRWDDVSLFDKLGRTVGEEEIQIARQIYDWMRKDGTRAVIFGTGKENGSVYPDLKPNGVKINPVYLSSDGKLWLQFASLDNKPVFGPIESRRALMEQFNAISNINFSDADLAQLPDFTRRTPLISMA